VMTDNNVKQAMMPEGAVIFPNRNGTADGCAIDCPEGNRMIVLLPGPPRELEPMFRDQVMPYLSDFADHVLVSKNVNICGMGESAVEAILRDRMQTATNPTEAPYCLEGEVRIRVTASAATPSEAERLCDRDIQELMTTPVAPYIYGVDTTLKEAVVKALKERGLTLFTAESCTGGLAAKEITDVSGSSRVLKGGVVSYTNEIKEGILGVSPETIARYTAVSEACAFGSPLNETGHIRDHKPGAVSEIDNAEIRFDGRKGIIRDLRYRIRRPREERGFSGVRKSDKSDIGDEL